MTYTTKAAVKNRKQTTLGRVGLFLLLAAVILATGPTYADLYYYDDDGLATSVNYSNASFANLFTVSDAGDASIQAVLLRQVPTTAGTADVYLWQYNTDTGLPGNVLAAVTGQNVSQGGAGPPWISHRTG